MAEHSHISRGWYEDGQIFERGFYSDGTREGEHKSWYPDGQLYQSDFYQNDRLEGKCQSYHSNGRIWLMEFYRDGKLEGEHKLWNEDGKLGWHRFFRDGYGVSKLTLNRKCILLKIRRKLLAKTKIPITDSMLILDLARISFTINRV